MKDEDMQTAYATFVHSVVQLIDTVAV